MAQSKGIVDVLHDLQVALKVPKNLWNDFGGYPYRSAESILQATKPLLPDGYAIICNTEPIEVCGRLLCKATASLVGVENTISATAYSTEPDSKKGMDSSQVSGSNGSYAKKYALGNLLAIDGTMDSDDPVVQAATEEPDVIVVDDRKETLNRLWRVVAQYCEQQNLDPKTVAQNALKGRELKEWPTDELKELADDFESQVV
jgi:hypothetical protein